MNNNFSDTKLLIGYIDKEISKDQQRDVKRKLKLSSLLRKELENLRLARIAVNMYGLHKKIISIHQEMMLELQAPKKRMSSFKNFMETSIIDH
jgi:hypothetical protein